MQAPTKYISDNPNPDYRKLALKEWQERLVSICLYFMTERSDIHLRASHWPRYVICRSTQRTVCSAVTTWKRIQAFMEYNRPSESLQHHCAKVSRPLHRLKRTAMRRYITSQLHTRCTQWGDGQERRQHQHLMTTMNLLSTQQQLCHFTPKRQSACRSAYRRNPKRSLLLNHNLSWIYRRNSCSTYSHISGRATSSSSSVSIALPSPS